MKYNSLVDQSWMHADFPTQLNSQEYIFGLVLVPYCTHCRFFVLFHTSNVRGRNCVRFKLITTFCCLAVFQLSEGQEDIWKGQESLLKFDPPKPSRSYCQGVRLAMDQVSSHLKGLGTLFYLVSPNETTFQYMEEVPKPDYTAKVRTGTGKEKGKFFLLHFH